MRTTLRSLVSNHVVGGTRPISMVCILTSPVCILVLLRVSTVTSNNASTAALRQYAWHRSWYKALQNLCVIHACAVYLWLAAFQSIQIPQYPRQAPDKLWPSTACLIERSVKLVSGSLSRHQFASDLYKLYKWLLNCSVW